MHHCNGLQFSKYREVARSAWIVSGNDISLAEDLFRDDARITKLNPMTIILLIQIAIQLWSLWKSRGISEPSVVACSDELAFSGDNE